MPRASLSAPSRAIQRRSRLSIVAGLRAADVARAHARPRSRPVPLWKPAPTSMPFQSGSPALAPSKPRSPPTSPVTDRSPIGIFVGVRVSRPPGSRRARALRTPSRRSQASRLAHRRRSARRIGRGSARASGDPQLRRSAVGCTPGRPRPGSRCARDRASRTRGRCRPHCLRRFPKAGASSARRRDGGRNSPRHRPSRHRRRRMRRRVARSCLIDAPCAGSPR